MIPPTKSGRGIAFLNCLCYLGQHITDRIISIHVVPPKVAKTSRVPNEIRVKFNSSGLNYFITFSAFVQSSDCRVSLSPMVLLTNFTKRSIMAKKVLYHWHLAPVLLCRFLSFRIFHQDDRYFIKDEGSSNGTFVNGQRLSDAKKESEPREIGHGSVLQIGTTKLLCHVHPGRETCFECEPGIVQVAYTLVYFTTLSFHFISQHFISFNKHFHFILFHNTPFSS
jgi:hypothetical protein